MISFTHMLQVEEGLHIRPAGMLVELAQDCDSKIYIDLNGKTADAKRIFSVMGLCAKQGDILRFRVEGDNEKIDASQLKEFCALNL